MAEEMPFGLVLRGFRQKRLLTIEGLAEASGVSVRAISDMERLRSRAPRRRTVAALAEGLALTDADREALLAAAVSVRPEQSVAAAGTALPRSVGDFSGREAEMSRLRDAAGRAVAGAGVSVYVVSGPPGCGKTTLALKAAADLADAFPDGCFVVDLHGVESPMDSGEALLRLLKSLGVTEYQLAQLDASGRAGLLRSLLGDRRCLVVLDNARDEGQVRPLLPAGGHSLVLVTSRRPLSGLEDVDRLALSGLAQEEAVELLRRILGTQRAEAGAVAEVAELCGRLPLALRVAGNWLTVRSGWSVGHLVHRLSDEERALGALTAGDVRVEAAFELSYRQLTGQAARMLRLLSVVPSPDMTAAYGAALSRTAVFDAEDVMAELVEAGLLQATFTGRYQLHDLLRLFARARLREEGVAERDAAEARLRDWLLDTATTAGLRFKDGQRPPSSAGQGLVLSENAEQARNWLVSESAAWFAALQGAAARGEHVRVAETAEALEVLGGGWDGWRLWSEVYRLSSEAATALGDPGRQASHLSNYAWTLGYEGRYREAIDRADQALECARRAGDTSQQAWALLMATSPHKQLGEFQAFMEKSRAAMELSEGAGDHKNWLVAMQSYRAALRDMGRVEESMALHDPLIALLDAPDSPMRQDIAAHVRARTISGLGRDYAALGRWREAAEQFRSGLLHVQRVGIPYAESSILLDLAEVLVKLGETEEARAGLRRILSFGETAKSHDLAIAQTLLASLPAGQ
ncbi:XRE family transcriptional regulator [Streptomyces sp. NBC_00102]|uniref:XRE family transcriptional regulator n=1 Tax=Streptomyces sp. NBC_00102 TaxID=2975652 RepID=UPI002259215F|nr:XRE family transcriptional regulator [Streptomyces sp. NBC_00102]MCX5396373.1 NB-ARC domain-containing protein [Streptomyces sp. NBC_00102]